MECEFCHNVFKKKYILNNHQKNTKYCLIIQKKINKNVMDKNLYECNACKFLILLLPPFDLGLIWSTSHPNEVDLPCEYLYIVLPYGSFLYNFGSLPFTGFAKLNTLAGVCF